MRRLAPLVILILSACGSGEPANLAAPQNVARPAPSAPPAKAPEAANAARPVQADVLPRDDPDLAGLSPRQRHAYDQGYRDCSAGRYDPDPYPEAYRIGCGAAHDRAEAARPQG